MALYYLYLRFYRTRASETDQMNRGGVIRVGETTFTNQAAPLLQGDNESDDEYIDIDPEQEDEQRADVHSTIDTLSSYVSFSGFGVFGVSNEKN